MSAWIVESGHIDVLVTGMVQHGIIRPADLTATGQLLWQENHDSVNYRYNESTPCPTYRPTVTEATLDPRHLLAAAQCYEYQSCEHDAWPSSRARDLIVRLSETVSPLTLKLPHLPTVYGDKEKGVRWGYSDVRQAIAA